ncbi:hypothetical protein GN244_ATG06666 [Phytophthora infestans]|uniref:Crinkler (CRN) family protein n=1 Tax=Phytophthora infestans TaxID=4787 RepID=A0A833W3N3_PHYIN|nr:hypothetical protein GN244_ATG06666 [Phytophthora infestans]KAF4142258.1 hypothetical protein GN958_ATG08434 [Phytophthora infestans]
MGTSNLEVALPTAMERTEEFSAALPMENLYPISHFYVRDCYAEYYELILKTLYECNYKIVTVTGTPGIGKSVFYGYFFHRYKSKPNLTIITASFTTESKMKEAVVFRGGADCGSASGSSHQFIRDAQVAALKRKDEVLFLYDGPPDIEPKMPSKMVCFASPNEQWLSKVSKKEEACTLYMPLWDEGELIAAAASLKMPISPQKIEERFSIFGGVARCCLARNEKFVIARKRELESDIAGMDSQMVLDRLLKGILGGPTHHRMCHYIPKRDDPEDFDVRIASKFVSLRVLEKISSRAYTNRDLLLSYLEDISKVAAFRGHLLEIKAHEQLVRGGDVCAKCISFDREFTETFVCQESDDFYFFNSEDLSRETLRLGPYHISRASNYESIDSFYYPIQCASETPSRCEVAGFGSASNILLFQMTVSPRHPVDGKGIVSVLDSLELLDEALFNPNRVKLIFVVANDSQPSLARKQPIPWSPAADSNQVSIIKHIDDAKMKQLFDLEIKTVRDLRRAVRGGPTNSLLAECQADLNAFDESQQLTERMLTSITQYVWEV